ncbi:hypothetical protein HOY80DRAFT_1062446 [Tuber brumale]|nr:hypothetical protein HOY80DRAFT_1062446 [Tuber brumale]
MSVPRRRGKSQTDTPSAAILRTQAFRERQHELESQVVSTAPMPNLANTPMSDLADAPMPDLPEPSILDLADTVMPDIIDRSMLVEQGDVPILLNPSTKRSRKWQAHVKARES